MEKLQEGEEMKMGEEVDVKYEKVYPIMKTMIGKTSRDTQTDFRSDYLQLFPKELPLIHFMPINKVDDGTIAGSAIKRKLSTDDADSVIAREIKKAKLETKALKAKRPGFTDERYNETSYFFENGLRKVFPYWFTFSTFTKGRWVGEKILDVFAREFRAHPVEEYSRCIKSGTLTVNYLKVETDYRMKHNDLLANIVHRHEVPVTSDPIEIVHMDEDLVVVNKPASIPVHPCGRYRHNTIVFILAKEYELKNLRTIHRLDRLTSGLLLFGRSPKKAREMEQQIRNRVVSKEYVCRVEGEFPNEEIECSEPILVVSYKIGVCKVSKEGKDCRTTFKKLSSNGRTSVVSAKPHTGRMHQIRVHLQYLGFPICNDPLYNHPVFGPEKGKAGAIGKSDEQLIQDLISIHNAENWLGIEGEESGGGDMFGMPQGTVGSPIVLDNLTPATSVSQELAEISTATTNDDFSPSVKNEARTSPEPERHGTLIEQHFGREQNNTGPLDVKCDKELLPEKVTVGTQTCSDDEEIPGSACSSGTTTSVNDETDADSVGSSNLTAAMKDNNNSSSTDYENFKKERMTYDPHCYECKVRYRDPKPKDLIMYLHAIRYGGPEWQFETKLPAWASSDWVEPD